MLATRIIPTILNKNSQLVKGKGFNSNRVVGHAYQASKIYGMRNVDELVLLDIMATQENRPPDYANIARLAENFFAPLTVGGGIKSIFHVKQLLRSGADKVAICTAALENPNLINEISDKFGRQCVTISIDAVNNAVSKNNANIIYGNKTVDQWALECEQRGAGEILLQSVPRDGTMQGYDIEMIERISEMINIPVVASGGCSGYEDMFNAIEAGASAVAAGSLFQFTEATPAGAAEYLKERGVEVR